MLVRPHCDCLLTSAFPFSSQINSSSKQERRDKETLRAAREASGTIEGGIKHIISFALHDILQQHNLNSTNIRIYHTSIPARPARVEIYAPSVIRTNGMQRIEALPSRG
jgi:hypothetical protein